MTLATVREGVVELEGQRTFQSQLGWRPSHHLTTAGGSQHQKLIKQTNKRNSVWKLFLVDYLVTLRRHSQGFHVLPSLETAAPFSKSTPVGHCRYTSILLSSQPPSEERWKMAKWLSKVAATLFLAPMLTFGHATPYVRADDELAKYAAEGNKVGVDGQCFMRKCAVETVNCANDPNCFKGLSCLARCKGGSLCSTGCFAKFGSDRLDNILSCSVEKHDCVHVPGKESVGWTQDNLQDLPGKPLERFDISSLEGQWYKKNTFKVKDKETLKMEALFRIPRPAFPGYMQNRIVEELHATKKDSGELAHLRSKGEMFGLTFWENWYVLSEAKPNPVSSGVPGVSTARASPTENADLKLVFYTGHTLQGSYKGAFVYSRTKDLTPTVLNAAKEVITAAGLNPNEFCAIRNQCFDRSEDRSTSSQSESNSKQALVLPGDEVLANSRSDPQAPYWYLGQKFFTVTTSVAEELADWFEDPAMVSDWLINQQQRMIFTQPMEVSPFASLANE
eukprot:scaffold1869_cov163-Ochromonas_danica.AAC.15